jgi:carboxyl-terminal processing protease
MKTTKFYSLAATTAVIALTTVLYVAPSYAQAQRDDSRTAKQGATISDTYKALNLFGDVFEQVRANYVDTVEDRKLIEYALNGMLSNLDPHSNYMTEEETKAMSIQNSGEFGGLGIEVTMENGVVKVVSPIDDTPAARAGVLSGDLIVELDGQPVMGMSLNEAIEKMRGRVGSQIILTVIRSGVNEPLKINLIRDTIKIQSVRSRVENENIGYIRITTFNAQTYSGLKKAFDDIKKQSQDKTIGYILDLRNNPGGLLDQAISVADAFLNKGEIVSTRGRNPEDMRRDSATSGDLSDEKPLVVLINGGSASASEIVAGALKDHKRGIVMGTRSFGKGSVQTIFDVPGGGSIKLTTARYYTPSGVSIQAKGIDPDIIVERAKVVAENDKFGEIHEADLKGALKNPDGSDAAKPADSKKGLKTPTLMPDEGKKGDEKKNNEKAEDPRMPSKDDYQLLRAIDLLQGIHLYKGDQPAAVPPDNASGVPQAQNR